MAYNISFEEDTEPTIFDSKLGGLPYWDFGSGKEFPTDSEGNKMQLLFQINIEKNQDIFAGDELLPKAGMLQFFISPSDDAFGLNFDGTGLGDGFAVVYHEEINYDATREAVEDAGVPLGAGDFSTPVQKECAARFEKCDGDVANGIFAKAEFTQDPPEFFDESQLVLLQLDSSGNEDYMMWGDEGIGNFFITEDDLRNRKFENVLYNWDCC